MTRSRFRWHYIAAIAWVLLTVSLATWWMIFGLDEAGQLQAMNAPQAIAMSRVQRMLTWEGGSFIALLLVAGAALVVSVRREQARQREIEAFFMAFTHDLKTALASLQLQVEALIEDWPEGRSHPNAERLLKDALRLQLQLENSLFFAEPDGGLYVESVDVRALAMRLSADWPELTLDVTGDARVRADTRALESVFRNLFQNAVTHGQATHLRVRVEAIAPDRVTVTATDDGRGAPSSVVETLGHAFSRPTERSGTGVGLFVSRRLVERMRGRLSFHTAPNAGFTTVLELPGDLPAEGAQA